MKKKYTQGADRGDLARCLRREGGAGVLPAERGSRDAGSITGRSGLGRWTWTRYGSIAT